MLEICAKTRDICADSRDGILYGARENMKRNESLRIAGKKGKYEVDGVALDFESTPVFFRCKYPQKIKRSFRRLLNFL